MNKEIRDRLDAELKLGSNKLSPAAMAAVEDLTRSFREAMMKPGFAERWRQYERFLAKYGQAYEEQVGLD